MSDRQANCGGSKVSVAQTSMKVSINSLGSSEILNNLELSWWQLNTRKVALRQLLFSSPNGVADVVFIIDANTPTEVAGLQDSDPNQVIAAVSTETYI